MLGTSKGIRWNMSPDTVDDIIYVIQNAMFMQPSGQGLFANWCDMELDGGAHRIEAYDESKLQQLVKLGQTSMFRKFTVWVGEEKERREELIENYIDYTTGEPVEYTGYISWHHIESVVYFDKENSYNILKDKPV